MSCLAPNQARGGGSLLAAVNTEAEKIYVFFSFSVNSFPSFPIKSPSCVLFAEKFGVAVYVFPSDLGKYIVVVLLCSSKFGTLFYQFAVCRSK